MNPLHVKHACELVVQLNNKLAPSRPQSLSRGGGGGILCWAGKLSQPLFYINYTVRTVSDEEAAEAAENSVLVLFLRAVSQRRYEFRYV